MSNRLALTLAASALLLVSTPPNAEAGPITYAFTGTLSEPVDGSQTFSGTFTINGTPTFVPGESSVSEDGSDVSITVNVGGHVTNFFNTSQNPEYATFGAQVLPNPYSQPTPGAPQVEFGLTGGVVSTGSSLSRFSLDIYSPWVSALPPNLASIPLPLYTASFGFTDASGAGLSGGGGEANTLTSIEIVSTPETSTLTMFVGLGVAVVARRCWRVRRRGRRAGRE